MFAIFLAALASQAAAGSVDAVWSGHCRYSAALKERAGQVTLIVCDMVSLNRDGDRATFDFRRRSWGSMIYFSGAMSGNRMNVDRVTLRTGKSLPATGECEIFDARGGVFAVKCLAKAGHKTYAANFSLSGL